MANGVNGRDGPLVPVHVEEGREAEAGLVQTRDHKMEVSLAVEQNTTQRSAT